MAATSVAAVPTREAFHVVASVDGREYRWRAEDYGDACLILGRFTTAFPDEPHARIVPVRVVR
jgi:hypothetical protein